MIMIKIVKNPGLLREVALNDGATVADALVVSGHDAEGMAITVNGVSGSVSTPLTDGATVTLSANAKGNA